MIRRASADDYIDICKISREDMGYECDEELVRMRLSELDSTREAVFVAEDDGKIMGFVHVEKYNLLYFESMANILGLAVAQSDRRKGLGRKLMAKAECWAKDNGIHIMRLNSGTGRTHAHSFYRAIGYNEDKKQLRFTKQLEAEM